jgi:oligopeptide transport system ATP-binding protein
MGLLAKNGHAAGSVRFNGQEILNAAPSVINALRAVHISMVFQDPMTSLNPYMRVADQMAEVLTHHQGMSKADAVTACLQMLDAVKIPDAKARIRLYPHEFSGGMRQRVMIAMALLCRPDLLIADEPTTALDVTVQAQIMSLLRELQADFGMATILITHDLGVIAGFCRDVMVLYGGQVMEQAPVDLLFESPAHPYTRGLINAIPRVDTLGETLVTIPGTPPNMLRAPKGCPFAPRCAYAAEDCDDHLAPLTAFAPGRLRACNRSLEDLA